ncbi:hypothetical protein I316_04074 [Kwoniella heveanensis BCC8398]|uniref:Major facilitator superfamily (MFS) profile domain-containing protein n=1 Tax=Kwoniella heveanensis BCC8398 TaxID=1296120 RepID=A0A1B9GTC9_9TREE|nr:hypothetical protein I316_04074 [Kwoniella heveanensis BCC8398]
MAKEDNEDSSSSLHSSTSTAAEMSYEKQTPGDWPLEAPYRSKYMDVDSPTGSESERHDSFPTLGPTISRPGPSRPRPHRFHTGAGSSELQTGEKLTRVTSSLSRMSSRQATEMEADLRRHISEHGKVRHSGELLEGNVIVDLGNGEEEVIIVDWAPDDPDNPFNWSNWRKYSILLVAVFITFACTVSISSTSILATWGTEYFGVGRNTFLLQLTLPLVSIAFAPLLLAPLSEVFGRNMIYQVTSIINAILFIPQVWSKNHDGVLVCRWFQGIAQSVGNSMVGGTVADMFLPAGRGVAMGVFTLMIFLGQGVGIPAMAWSGQELGMKWTYGIQAIAAVVSIGLNLLFLRETRSDVLLSRRAKKLTAKTGKKHLCAADLQKKSIASILSVSLIRPLQFLFTEPIVTALSLWIGFAWACVFLGGSSIILIFESYGFDAAQAGTFELTLAIGAFLGFASQQHQEYLYGRAARKNNGRAPPEARLYWAAYGGLMFPLGLYVSAWTGQPEVCHWAVPAVALCFSYWGVYCMYCGVFTYLADAYETYSSSAQASHSFARNILGAVFPLFARSMYIKMGYPEASTLVASLALALAAAPIALLFYGKSLRKRSKITSALCKDE